MAATFTIVKPTTGRTKLKIENYPTPNLFGDAIADGQFAVGQVGDIRVESATKVAFLYQWRNNKVKVVIDVTTDTVIATVNEITTTYAPDDCSADAMLDVLNTAFASFKAEGGGSGTTPTLQAVVTEGGLANGSNISVGEFDNGTGGNGGIDMVCAVGYGLNWQGGQLRKYQKGDPTGLPLEIPVQSNLNYRGIRFEGLTNDSNAELITPNALNSFVFINGFYTQASAIPTGNKTRVELKDNTGTIRAKGYYNNCFSIGGSTVIEVFVDFILQGSVTLDTIENIELYRIGDEDLMTNKEAERRYNAIKRISMLVTQSGTDAPVIQEIFLNTLEFIPTFIYISTGTYYFSPDLGSKNLINYGNDLKPIYTENTGLLIGFIKVSVINWELKTFSPDGVTLSDDIISEPYLLDLEFV